MKVTRKVLFELPPKENNPRNSEGDFIRLPDGKYMFAYTHYFGTSWDDHEDSEIRAIYSRDGEHFDVENEKTIFRPERAGGNNAMSATLRPNGKGGVLLYCIVKYDTKDLTQAPVRDEIWRIDSPDGYDFSAEPLLIYPKSRKGYYATNNCRIETTASGRMFLPMAVHNMTFVDGKYRFIDSGKAYFLYSDDGGVTWNEDVQVLEFPDEPNKNGLQEPGIVELPDGMLYGYFRTDADYQYESFSRDGGVTWSRPRPSRFESPLSPMTIRKNPYSGKYYAIWNPYRDDPESTLHPRYRNTWGRTPLAIAESDDGINFSDFVLLEDDIHRGYCYPAIFFLNEREALVSYCSGGRDIVPLQRTTVSKITID